MDRWVGKVAVVTGASAGIGAAICKQLAEAGVKVAGFARREERVQELSKECKGPGKIYAVKCDVTKQEEVEKSFKWVKENLGPVQILVNNAGLFKLGKIIDGNPEDWKTVLDTNVLGLTMCSKEAISQMKEAGVEGHIVHINSVAGHYTLAGFDPLWFNIYSPTKHAVTCLTEVMRKEIVHSKCDVKVTSVSPGAVKTEIAVAAGIDLSKLDLTTEMPMLTAEDVSDAVCYVIGTPPHVNIQELTIRPSKEGVYN